MASVEASCLPVWGSENEDCNSRHWRISRESRSVARRLYSLSVELVLRKNIETRTKTLKMCRVKIQKQLVIQFSVVSPSCVHSLYSFIYLLLLRCTMLPFILISTHSFFLCLFFALHFCYSLSLLRTFSRMYIFLYFNGTFHPDPIDLPEMDPGRCQSHQVREWGEGQCEIFKHIRTVLWTTVSSRSGELMMPTLQICARLLIFIRKSARP